MKIIISFILTILTLQPLAGVAAQESVEELAARGSEAFARDDFDKAHDLYQKALELEPGKAALLYNMANVLYRKNKFEEALELYGKTVKTGPPRALLSSIYFNSGNTAMKLAELQIAEKQELADLKKALAYYEQSFEMYRNSLEHARAVSISQGRNVQEAGLYARQNWALARESWTQAWEKIREIEKKNLKLEDGVLGLLQVQLDLLPTLERMFLNSFSEDILNFNLKKLAEYQLDYQSDITTLKKLAANEEEKLQVEIDNLKASQPAAGQGAPAPEPDLEEISEQLQVAAEVKKAVQKVGDLDEWVIDGLKRGEPLQAWHHNRQMIDLLKGLVVFLKKNDPAQEAFQSLVVDLGEAENLLRQAASLTEMKDNETAQSAGAKRTDLAQAKTAAAIGIGKNINRLLEQIKTNQQENSEPEQDSAEKSSQENSDETSMPASPQTTVKDLLEEAGKELIIVGIDELLKKNTKIIEELEQKDISNTSNKDVSLSEQLSQATAALLWYQHLSSSVPQGITSLIKDVETVGDRVLAYLDKDSSGEEANAASLQLEGEPNEEKFRVLLFQLENVLRLVSEQENVDAGVASDLTKNLENSTQSLKNNWKGYTDSRSRVGTSSEIKVFSLAASNLRQSLFDNLLIFSPETAIALYYDRTKEVHDRLAELLPARVENIPDIESQYKASAKEAKDLTSLLGRYFSGLEKAVEKIDNQEKQSAYAGSIPTRRKSVQFAERFVKAGHDGNSLLKEKKLQQAELLFKDMANSLDKSRLAFSEQPSESDKLITFAIELQKKLEEQSRAANEAAAIEGKPDRLTPHMVSNQVDIKEVTDSAISAIEQTIGMAEIPTHGQENQPGSSPDQKIDTAKLRDAIDKAGEAQVEMEKVKTFLAAAEFHNTLSKHQEIINLLQEALDLVTNKSDEKDKEKGEDQKQDGEQQSEDSSENQQGDQQSNGNQGGSSQPKKPLELGPQEARELLQQLNQQDEKEQGKKTQAHGERVFDSPRPW